MWRSAGTYDKLLRVHHLPCTSPAPKRAPKVGPAVGGSQRMPSKIKTRHLIKSPKPATNKRSHTHPTVIVGHHDHAAVCGTPSTALLPLGQYGLWPNATQCLRALAAATAKSPTSGSDEGPFAVGRHRSPTLHQPILCVLCDRHDRSDPCPSDPTHTERPGSHVQMTSVRARDWPRGRQVTMEILSRGNV